VLWEFRNALWVFPLFLMGKIVLTHDQLELRPALANELSSYVKDPLYIGYYSEKRNNEKKE
jgi:hypothetical protein